MQPNHPKITSALPINRIVVTAACIFFILLILPLGTGIPQQVELRIAISLALAVITALAYRATVKKIFQVKCFYFFVLVLLFQTARTFLQSGDVPSAHSLGSARQSFLLEGDIVFLSWVGVFAFSFILFSAKRAAQSLLFFLGWGGFFLAMCLCANGLRHERFAQYLRLADDSKAYFYPTLLHQWDFADRFLLARFAHPNLIGDIIAIGVFASLGIMLYSMYVFFLARSGQALSASDLRFGKSPLLTGVMYLFVSLVGICAIFLAYSRGTILCFVITSAVLTLFFFLKFMSKKYALGWVIAAVVSYLFLSNTIDLGRVFGEVQTLQEEKDTERSSLSTTLEGIRRSKLIYKDSFPWGVGYGGYEKVSRKYAAPQPSRNLRGANSQAISHYYQVLAEQGIGAWLYFAFILIFFVEWLVGLYGTSSHFKFIAGLSLGAPVLLIFTHASFAFLMERYMIAACVYGLMGAALGVLHKDFRHAE